MAGTVHVGWRRHGAMARLSRLGSSLPRMQMRGHQKSERRREVIATGSLGWIVRDAMGMAREGTRIVTGRISAPAHQTSDLRSALADCGLLALTN
jgi:hypothetical protein